MSELNELILWQMRYLKLENYENELETIKILNGSRMYMQGMHNKLNAQFLKKLKSDSMQNRCSEQLTKEAKQLREDGNRLMLTKGREHNLLAACQLYTKAIMKAPPHSEELPLAYANRAMALQEFGYYQEAYDDCECALEYGYPDRLLHKLYARQAVCALKMGNIIKLKMHLDALTELELNINFQAQVKELKMGLEALQNKGVQSTGTEKDICLNRQGQIVMDSGTARGRYMLAQQDVLENEIVFGERAQSFVPVAGWLICQQCAATLIVPLPCPHCYGQVVYCSLKCRTEHTCIHRYECAAYQHRLFDHIGISHLALRIFLEGLPQILPLLEHKQTAAELWEAATSKKSSIHESESINYAETLRMVTHLDKMSLNDIIWFALVAKLLVFYLVEYTQFFELVKQTECSKQDWELFTAAMILRHIGQLVVNAHSSVSIVPIYAKPQEDLQYPLFAANIWLKPMHIKRGMLHQFSDYEEIAAANFPYLSLCNHSCLQTFQPKFSGRYVQTYACRDVKANEEIFNCYTLDYRKSKSSSRIASLDSTYHFICTCEKCTRKNPDQDYERFHRYRCENSACRQIFVPYLPQCETLNWWHSDSRLPRGEYIRCTECQAQQHCIWFNDLNDSLSNAESSLWRSQLFEKFDALNNWLLDYHELKLVFAFHVVRECFNAHMAGSVLSNKEFAKVTETLKFYLRGMAEQSRVNSLEYVVKMTYLWDIIALGRYKCSHMEFQTMLDAINTVSDEMNVIFLHYYNDYIKDILCER